VTPSRQPTSRPSARRQQVGHPGVAGLVAALLLSALAAMVPGSNAAFLAQVTNSANTVSTQPFFTCAAAITASAPRVYYKLDETSGTTATDSSGQTRNGTYQGTTTKGAGDACVRDPGTAVAFDGSTGYLSLATSLTVPVTYSCEAWFKTTTTTGGLIAGFGAAATGPSPTIDRVLYMTNAGALVFGNNNNASKATISAAGPYNDNQWHHAMATVGTSGMRLYLDGKQVATSATTATTTYTGYFRVGYDNLTGWPSTPTTSYFKGTLDEVAAYSTTLTATDATNHYQAGI
jgi:hypothetical protein